jgi:hypothetical protein
VRNAIEHPWAAGYFLPALGIGGGVMVYLIGDALLRRTLRLGPLLPRLGALLLAGASIAVGTFGSPIAQLVMIALTLLGALAMERRRKPVTP